MSANELLISVIGLFVLVMGVMYIDHLRKNPDSKKQAMQLSWAVMAVGVGVMVFPLISLLIGSEDSADKHRSVLVGSEAFEQAKSVPTMEDHAMASHYYELGVKLYVIEGSIYEKVDSAMYYFNKSVELYPTAESLTARGQLKVQLGKMESGLEDYNKAIELKPEFGNAYYNRAAVYYIYGNLPQACSDWTMANQLGVPNTDEVLKTMCN